MLVSEAGEGTTMILVQREFTVPAEHRAEFERQSREGTWPALLHYGAQMVAFGSWSFGGDSGRLVAHTAYEDFEHRQLTREGGGGQELLGETEAYRTTAATREELVTSSVATPFELFMNVRHPAPFRRSAGQRLAETPPSFGRGSVVSERTLAIADGQRDEFIRLSGEVIWPWLESQGGRGIAIGHNLMGASNEITTWFSFPDISLWYRCARPHTANAPEHVVDAYQYRHSMVRHQRGRVLTIGTDWGALSE